MQTLNKLSVKDVDLNNKRVLMRVDYNVPLKENEVMDSTRIKGSLNTIKYIMDNGAHSLVLMSHCGRPNGRRDLKYSLKPAALLLQKLIERPVIFLNDCVGEEVENKCRNCEKGSIILLENLRFHIEEEGKGLNENGEKVKADPENEKKFRESLTKLGDIYVNDAFGTAHRAHSSMVGIELPIRCSGLLVEKELNYFSAALSEPKRPFLSILGGAKVRDKIQLIENLLNQVDVMIIGGGMAYTFLKVLYNMPIGNSLWDQEGSALVPKIMEKAKNNNIEIYLPQDFIISDRYGEDGIINYCTREEGVPDGFEGLDCGKLTIETVTPIIKSAKTIIWNGPQGVSEMKAFANGSLCFLDAVIDATKQGAISIIGGGDTAALAVRSGKSDQVSHISTGGGASLELLEGKVLPGIAALTNKH